MTTSNQEIKAIKSEMKELAELVKSAAHSASSNGHATLASFSSSDLRKAARKAGCNLRRFASDKQEQAEELREYAEESITSHPFKSVAAAVVGGVVLGLLLRGK